MSFRRLIARLVNRLPVTTDEKGNIHTIGETLEQILLVQAANDKADEQFVIDTRDDILELRERLSAISAAQDNLEERISRIEQSKQSAHISPKKGTNVPKSGRRCKK